jgi:L-fuconate dehydratase
LVADLTPEELINCIDFSYLTDAISKEEALHILRKASGGKAERKEFLKKEGYPAYTTSAGWLGYSDDQVVRLCKEAIEDGWTHLKMKVGADLENDLKRGELIRKTIGEKMVLMMDANQKWEVDEAIEAMSKLKKFDPYWIEEPTSPDDILGHLAISKAVAPIKVATGEHCQNRVIFKQLITSGAIQVCQIDSCRVGGVNENLAIMLLAAKYDIPVCPHAGGVGLCEHVQHLSMIDFVCISGKIEDRMIEYVDHLHDHFSDPVVIQNGRYMAPQKPGYSTEVKKETLEEFKYPLG